MTTPIEEFAAALQTHVALGGAVTPEAIQSCAVGAKVRVEDWAWLASTDALQREAYGFDPASLKDETVQVNALQYYLTWNLLAAFIELAEMSVEFGWAPWATDGVWMNPDRMRDEAVDAGHFIGNILGAAGVSDKAYETAYQAKQARNRLRAASGTYSKKKGGLGEGSDVD